MAGEPYNTSSLSEEDAIAIHTRAITDLLNERSRGGWEPAMMSQDEQRVTILFQRDAVAEG